MNKIPTLLACLILLTVAGCRQPFAGGGAGFSGHAVGNKALMHAFGWDQDNKLVYVIFSDLDSEDTSSSVGGDWSGSFKSKKRSGTIDYEASATGITIDGTRYDFSAGRVFLLSMTSGAPSVTQVSTPLSGVDYKAEITALESQADVKKFREAAGAP